MPNANCSYIVPYWEDDDWESAQPINRTDITEEVNTYAHLEFTVKNCSEALDLMKKEYKKDPFLI